jgi:hypothetical protein
MFTNNIKNYVAPKEFEKHAHRNKNGKKHLLEDKPNYLNDALDNYRFHKIKSKSYEQK